MRLPKTRTWTPHFEGENIIALHREDMANITLEPGGQVELSGAPHRTLSALADEMRANRDALLKLSADQDHVHRDGTHTGIAPIATIPWVPKGRYGIMKRYLPQRGDLAAYMMKGTQCPQLRLRERVGLREKFALLWARPADDGALRELSSPGEQAHGFQVLSGPHLDPNRSGSDRLPAGAEE